MSNYSGIQPYADLVHEAAAHGGPDAFVDMIATHYFLLGEEATKEVVKRNFLVGTIIAGVGLLVTGISAYALHTKKQKKQQEELEEKTQQLSQATKDYIEKEIQKRMEEEYNGSTTKGMTSGCNNPEYEHFREKSIIVRKMENQSALDLMDYIISGKSIVNIDLSDVMEIEERALYKHRDIRYEYCPCISEEEYAAVMKEWADKHSDAENVLLFIEGYLRSSAKLADDLQQSMGNQVTIYFGIKEGKPGCVRVLGIFI